MRTLAERIKHLRRISCLKGQEFADLINVSKAYISQLEKGVRTNLNDDKIATLSRYFSVNSDWIKDGVGPPPVNYSPPQPAHQPPSTSSETDSKKTLQFHEMGGEKGIDRDELRRIIEEMKRLLGDFERIYKRK